MNWIFYAVACVVLYGVMQFFIKLSSGSNDPVASSMVFITFQFLAQIILGAYLITKSDLNMDMGSLKYSMFGGIIAAVATILFFLALESGPLSKVVPIANMSLLIAVLIGVVLLKETMSLRIAAGIFSAILSIYLLTNGN